MSEEERRRCCILGGCGCGPDNQTNALAELIAGAVQGGGTEGSEDPGPYFKAANAILEIFGRDGHEARLRELGLPKH